LTNQLRKIKQEVELLKQDPTRVLSKCKKCSYNSVRIFIAPNDSKYKISYCKYYKKDISDVNSEVLIYCIVDHQPELNFGEV